MNRLHERVAFCEHILGCKAIDFDPTQNSNSTALEEKTPDISYYSKDEDEIRKYDPDVDDYVVPSQNPQKLHSKDVQRVLAAERRRLIGRFQRGSFHQTSVQCVEGPNEGKRINSDKLDGMIVKLALELLFIGIGVAILLNGPNNVA
ncbi:hypothetical protein HDU79_010074 [Rhizoclosmatium sp. JEL0117]|nr:hypothetical protein HDU79_010074 [Rhizoclosmatium sp. JEL0117]